MMATKEKVKKTISLGIPWWTIIQTSLLVYRYGTGTKLPWWVTWFPTVVAGTIIGGVLLVLLIVVIIVGFVEILDK